MSPVFAHGQLRLYLLSLLDEAPRHGYEVIRALEDRFEGLYSPSAGTVYPRLARLEEEGLVEREDAGRRAVYRITDAGREEVRSRRGDLADLDADLTESVRRLAAEVREQVRTASHDLRGELAAAARAARAASRASGTTPPGPGGPGHATVEEAMERLRRTVRQDVRRRGADGELTAEVTAALTEAHRRITAALERPGA